MHMSPTPFGQNPSRLTCAEPLISKATSGWLCSGQSLAATAEMVRDPLLVVLYETSHPRNDTAHSGLGEAWKMQGWWGRGFALILILTFNM